MRSPSLLETLQAHGAQLGREEPAEVQHYGDPGAEASQGAERGGVRDQSTHGRVRLAGSDRLPFLNGQCTADLLKLSDSSAAVAVMTTVKGRVIDLVRIAEDGESLLLVTSPGQGSTVTETLRSKVVMEDCALSDASEDWASLLAFGPNAPNAVQTVFGSAPEPREDGYGLVRCSWGGDSVLAFATRAPSGGIELLLPPARAGEAFDALTAAGLHPVGEEAFDQLRIEEGMQALGHEMGDHTNPLEAGLQYAVSFTKGCYVGQEVVARLHSRGKVKRQLVGLRFPLDADPADLDELFWDLLRVGNISSAVRSPRLGATIALALIKSDYGKAGTPVYSVKNSARIEGEVSALPFA